jgi:hypothetical protein
LKIDNPTKTILAIITALVMLLSIVVPTMAFQNGVSPAGANYVVLEGTAGSDAYSSMQYSYMVNQWAVADGLYAATSALPSNVYYDATKSLRLGLTEYGEMATPADAGIAYGANNAQWNLTESWASSQIPPSLWIQGWVFFLNYTRQGVERAVEAWAMYSNTSTTEGARQAYSWYGNYNPADVGAVLTVGTLNPTGIEILYDSARLVVARTGTVIHDAYYNEDVAEVWVTINYYKDMKYAIVDYDVQILIAPKILDLINNYAFSTRYELDIDANQNPSNEAYIHYYHAAGSTVYEYPLLGTSTYDMLQAYDANHTNIFFAGYWPSTTEYTVYNQLLPNPTGNNVDLLAPGTAVADLPGPPTSPKEPSTPWVITQWQYNSVTYPNLVTSLAKGPAREMRFVAVLGMTDFNTDPHHAEDANDALYGVNQVDTEVQYMLYNVFNPTDLNSLKTTTDPFMYTALGQTSQTTDSAAASVLGNTIYSALGSGNETALPLFDKNDTAGSIPFGLDPFTGNYYQTFSNSGEGTGSDTTTYKREGLLDYVPGANEEYTESGYPFQPIAGGWDNDSDYWLPSINPLTQAWPTPFTSTSPIVSYSPNGILSLGGDKANQITRYFNDFGVAIDREGTSGSYYALVKGGTVTGTAPTSDATMKTLDFYPISTWDVPVTTFGYTANYAVISLVKDVNGTRGLSIYGWNGRDTYWAAVWASQYLFDAGGNTTQVSSAGLPAGTVAVVLQMTYGGPNGEPSAITIVKALGTITEFGTNAFVSGSKPFDTNSNLWTGLVKPMTLPESGVWWQQKLPTTSTASVEYIPSA